MSHGAGQPPSFLRYVAGDISEGERARIELHLDRCQECRVEAGALTSMARSLRMQSRVDHIDAEDLAQFEEGVSHARPDSQAALRAHLAECVSCREDLDLLRSARRRELLEAMRGAMAAPADGVVTKPNGIRGAWVIASAASVVLVAALGAFLLMSPPIVPDSGVTPTVVFAAPRRGVESPIILEGEGPWVARILLPLDAPPGRYLVSVGRAGQAPIAGRESASEADVEGVLMIDLDRLPAPGSYVLSARASDRDGAVAYLYPFAIVPQAKARPVSN